MPHVIVKLLPGRSEEQKLRMTSSIANAAKEILGAADASISVAFEEVGSDAWMAEVYELDIQNKPDSLYKKPDYGPSV